MPHKTSSGKHIFPASEVAEYTVCPNAWYLKRMSREPILEGPEMEQGEEIHKQWAEDLEYEFTLGRMLRLVAALISAATVLLLILRHNT
ncbi:MAG: hypothetical protein KDD70_00105 [Bdellovibrionales bacterium]|nr:hypothetical protein [Bdellovibrionales bacterium]